MLHLTFVTAVNKLTNVYGPVVPTKSDSDVIVCLQLFSKH